MHEAVTFLLDHLPPRSPSRSPPARTRRCRCRGCAAAASSLELRAADLRFTPDEAEAFLNQVMGLDLEPAHVAALEARTEGWAAGLQLAALVRPRPRTTAVGDFVDAFTGSHRFVLDYLVEEVLDSQPDDVRRLPSRHLGAPPADRAAVRRAHRPRRRAADARGARARQPVRRPARRPAAVVPLPPPVRRRARAPGSSGEHPDRVPGLHRAAARWYADHGAARRRRRPRAGRRRRRDAADLVELALPELRKHRHDRMLRDWLQRPARGRDPAPRPAGRVPGLDPAVRRGPRCGRGLARRRRDGARIHRRRAPPASTLRDPRSCGCCRRRSRCIAPRPRRPAATSTAPSRTPAAPSPWPGRDDHLSRGGAAGFLGLAAWAAGDLTTARSTRSARRWRACTRPATSPTSSARPSSWPACGWPAAGRTRRGGCTSGRWRPPSGIPVRCCPPPATCTWAWPTCSASRAISTRPTEHLRGGPRSGRPGVAAGEPAPLVHRHGRAAAGPGRPRRRGRLLDDAESAVPARVLPRRAAHPGREGAGPDRPGPPRRRVGLGPRAPRDGRRPRRPTWPSSTSSRWPGCSSTAATSTRPIALLDRRSSAPPRRSRSRRQPDRGPAGPRARPPRRRRPGRGARRPRRGPRRRRPGRLRAAVPGRGPGGGGAAPSGRAQVRRRTPASFLGSLQRDQTDGAPADEGLSDRELEVLRLLATDLTGPEIAGQPVRLGQHAAHPHQAHLHQARREHPAGRGAPGHRARPAARRITTRLTSPGDVGSPRRLLASRTSGHPLGTDRSPP